MIIHVHVDNLLMLENAVCSLNIRPTLVEIWSVVKCNLFPMYSSPNLHPINSCQDNIRVCDDVDFAIHLTGIFI